MSGFVMWETGFFGVPHPLCLGRVWLGPHCRSQGCRQHFQGWLGKQSEAFLTHRSANWGFRDEERLDLPGSEGRDVLCTAHSCGGIVAPGGSSAALGLRGALGTPSLPQSSSTFGIPTSASANPGQGSSSSCCCQGNQGGESEPGLICSTGLLIKKPACPPLPSLRAPAPQIPIDKSPRCLLFRRGSTGPVVAAMGRDEGGSGRWKRGNFLPKVRSGVDLCSRSSVGRQGLVQTSFPSS